jgi:hypothetical protein
VSEEGGREGGLRGAAALEPDQDGGPWWQASAMGRGCDEAAGGGGKSRSAEEASWQRRCFSGRGVILNTR